jgi:hypothetical protein
VKRNFNELFSKMKPQAQERVKARSSELLQEMALAEDVLTPSTDANATSSADASPEGVRANRKVALRGSK